ncbi:MAG: MBL fold metallo-hydrolase, partial [Deltaproteobacteria bacterium]|nr:MBL fold metallo-hydrolase [Deltaproteobacteria bacterium]
MIRLPVGPLEVNCYIIWDEETREAVIIDPGWDADKIELAIKAQGLIAVYIVNTHGHFDHVGANAGLRKSLGVKTAIHGKDAGLLAASHEHGAIYGYTSVPQPKPDILLKDGDIIKAGKGL